MKKVSADYVKRFLDESEASRLINVLPEDSYREKHIPGSTNVPLAKDSFTDQVEKIVGDKEAEVVVYCANVDCDASPKAAEKLEERGFRHVSDFEGGVAEWEQAGYALEGQAVGK